MSSIVLNPGVKEMLVDDARISGMSDNTFELI